MTEEQAEQYPQKRKILREVVVLEVYGAPCIYDAIDRRRVVFANRYTDEAGAEYWAIQQLEDPKLYLINRRAIDEPDALEQTAVDRWIYDNVPTARRFTATRKPAAEAGQ